MSIKDLSPKKRVFIILIALSIASIGYITYLAAHTPKTTPDLISPEVIVSTNPLVRSAKINTIVLDPQIKFPSLPDKLPVFVDISGSPNIVPFAEALANQLKLKKDSTLENYWSSEDNSAFLDASTQNQSLTYQIDGYKKPQVYQGSFSPRFESALQIATTFIQANTKWKDFVPDMERVAFLSNKGGHLEVVDVSDKYNQVRIPFRQTINGLPLHRQALTTPALTITIGPKLQIVKIEAHALIARASISGTDYPILPIDKVQQEVVNQKGTLINIQSDELILTPPSALGSITLRQVWLEYRSLSTGSRILPYWHFVGSSDTLATYVVHIILPAIKL